MARDPQLSMIIVTDGAYEVAARTVAYTAQQTRVADVELIVACKSKSDLKPDLGVLEKYGAYQIVEVPDGFSTGHFLAAAIRAARAPAVMYLEEHNYPPPNTAEVAIKELVVNERPTLGFGMIPSNPGTVAWAHIYGQFATAVSPVQSGPVVRFGGHHAAYRRDLLLGFGEKLETMMNDEAVMHEHLRRHAVPLFITSEVTIPHAQISDFRTLVRQDYLAMRVFAAARVNMLEWSLARRVLYVFGSPLIPFKRTLTAIYHIFRTRRARELLLATVPVIFTTQIAGTFGEALGYLIGASETNRRDRFEIELDRYAFVNPLDRKQAQDGNHIRKA